MITIADKPYRTSEDTGFLAPYEEVAFRSWKEANAFEPKARVKGVFCRRDVFASTPGYDGALARAGFVALGLFAPTRA